MKKLIRNIVKSTGIMGLMALLIAAAALAAGTPSASAPPVNTWTGGANPGKLNVSVYAAQGGLSGLSNASTVVLDGKGEAIVKGTTNNKGSFASYVPEGVYTLKVSAPGYQGFSTPSRSQPARAQSSRLHSPLLIRARTLYLHSHPSPV